MLKKDARKACTQTFCSSVRGVHMAVGPSVDGWAWGTEFPDGVVFVEVFDDAFAAATPMPSRALASRGVLFSFIAFASLFSACANPHLSTDERPSERMEANNVPHVPSDGALIRRSCC